MTGIGSYSSATAFRQALEDRLKAEALQTGVPYDRLRKEAAFHRLLARLQRVAPQDSWALKGALALIARIGTHVRATRDVDANWRRVQAELEETLDAVIDIDLGDGFEFEIGDATIMEGEGPEGCSSLHGHSAPRRQDIRAAQTGHKPHDRRSEAGRDRRSQTQSLRLHGGGCAETADDLACPTTRREAARLLAPVRSRCKALARETYSTCS